MKKIKLVTKLSTVKTSWGYARFHSFKKYIAFLTVFFYLFVCLDYFLLGHVKNASWLNWVRSYNKKYYTLQKWLLGFWWFVLNMLCIHALFDTLLVTFHWDKMQNKILDFIRENIWLLFIYKYWTWCAYTNIFMIMCGPPIESILVHYY